MCAKMIHYHVAIIILMLKLCSYAQSVGEVEESPKSTRNLGERERERELEAGVQCHAISLFEEQ